MSPRFVLIAVALLSQTGCVAAIPMAAQLMSNPNSTAQLCAMTKMPGQTTSLCDRMTASMTTQTTTQGTPKTPATTPINTAAR
jgi:Tfp pilus assembly major pilin PilA